MLLGVLAGRRLLCRCSSKNNQRRDKPCAWWIEGVPLADLDLAICGPCRRGVIEHVRTDVPHRRRGYGRVLVAAALTLAPPTGYQWPTTRVNDDPVARAFWAGITFPGVVGEPAYCTDMERTADRLPDW